MERSPDQSLAIHFAADTAAARRVARDAASQLGFGEAQREEIAIVASELAANLVEHASGGMLSFSRIARGGELGLQIESHDQGPGIADEGRALADGFSTGSSLGYGLGTVNRLMDELEIHPAGGPSSGTHIVCRRWLRPTDSFGPRCPLAFGVATRPHPRMTVNGDSFVTRRWASNALVGIIDGVGHGTAAQQAAATARQYVETHYDQPMAALFAGVDRACRSSRGVVMALLRFDPPLRMTFASIGNIEARWETPAGPESLYLRRGVLGFDAPRPLVKEHDWVPGSTLVMHSDGVQSHWRLADFSGHEDQSPSELAYRMLTALAREEDDATVLVVRDAQP